MEEFVRRGEAEHVGRLATASGGGGHGRRRVLKVAVVVGDEGSKQLLFMESMCMKAKFGICIGEKGREGKMDCSTEGEEKRKIDN
ncbi:unnamed protein product, partial [Linum tenue]